MPLYANPSPFNEEPQQPEPPERKREKQLPQPWSQPRRKEPSESPEELEEQLESVPLPLLLPETQTVVPPRKAVSLQPPPLLERQELRELPVELEKALQVMQSELVLLQT